MVINLKSWPRVFDKYITLMNVSNLRFG